MRTLRTSIVLCQMIAIFIASRGVARSEAEWNVMVYLNADNDLEPFGISDFFEMAAVGSSEKVNILVQFDRIPEFDDSEEDWTNTLRFLVKKDMRPIPSAAIENLGEVNMGDPKSLSDFIRWSRINYPAKRDMLVIWDHGQGWRLRSAITRPKAGTQPTETSITRRLIEMARKGTDRLLVSEPEVTAPEWAIEGSVKYVSTDDSSKDHLFNREVQNALETMGERPIDVIGFDACLMQMIETSFSIRRVGLVMTGSEELEPGDGWNYQILLTRLIAEPTMSAEKLGQTVVESYKSHYEKRRERTTLSALKLTGANAVSNATSQLADACAQRLATENANIRAARNACKNYAQGYGLHGIDLRRFCEQLKSRTQDSVLRDRATDVMNSVDAMMLAKYASPGSQGDYGSQGLSIYFPKTLHDYQADPDGTAYDEANTIFPVEFVTAHRWDNFLHSYFTLNP